MARRLADGCEARFATYVEELGSVIGHADRVAPLEAYCTGLLLPCDRKSVEPMAAVMAPSASFGPASIDVALHQPRRLVRREGPRQGARDRAAGDGTARTD